MVDYPETPDLDSEEWMVYDEHCWFKLLGTHGFSQVHVSLLHTCVCELHDKMEKPLQEMDIGDHILLQVELRRWQFLILYRI
jgi:hypothetical protein